LEVIVLLFEGFEWTILDRMGAESGAFKGRLKEKRNE
jgi:hypothetical protein